MSKKIIRKRRVPQPSPGLDKTACQNFLVQYWDFIAAMAYQAYTNNGHGIVIVQAEMFIDQGADPTKGGLIYSSVAGLRKLGLRQVAEASLQAATRLISEYNPETELVAMFVRDEAIYSLRLSVQNAPSPKVAFESGLMAKYPHLRVNEWDMAGGKPGTAQ